MTAKAVLASPKLTENAIVIVQKESRLAIECGDVEDLDLHPVERRAFGHIAVHDTPRADLHHDKHVDDREQRGVLRHEVAGKELVAVVLDERAPLLPIIAWLSPRHVLANGAGGMADTELDSQLLVDLVLPPGWVVGAHSPDELDVLARDSGPAQTLRVRPPSPVELEALAVPPDHGLGFHDDQGGGPFPPQPREPDPKGAIEHPKARALAGALVRGELLTQGEIFQDERLSMDEEAAQEASEQRSSGHSSGRRKVERFQAERAFRGLRANQRGF